MRLISRCCLAVVVMFCAVSCVVDEPGVGVTEQSVEGVRLIPVIEDYISRYATGLEGTFEVDEKDIVPASDVLDLDSVLVDKVPSDEELRNDILAQIVNARQNNGRFCFALPNVWDYSPDRCTACKVLRCCSITWRWIGGKYLAMATNCTNTGRGRCFPTTFCS